MAVLSWIHLAGHRFFNFRILNLIPLAVCASLLPFVSSANAAEFKKTPLPDGHPLIGVWKIEVPGTTCEERYNVRGDGTMVVTSAAQVVEAELSIGQGATGLGFYTWTDHILSENGKADCLGNVMTVGHSAMHYITVHQSGEKFLMCQQENLDTCIGPFVRESGI